MSLIEKIDTDLATAMRASETSKVSVLRMLKSSIKNEQIKLGHELSDDEVMAVLKREAKQRRDSIEQYEKAERDDLADVEKTELEVIKSYLPEQLSEDELTKAVDEVISETGASSPSEMGVVMGAVLKKVGSRADGSMVAKIVRERLNS